MPLHTKLTLGLRASAASLLLASLAIAEPAVTSHVKVTCDKTPDVSSLEAWKQSFIKPGMTDRQKAMAVWQTVVAFRHQDAPPNEHLQAEDNPHDPIKDFNVYGYGQCCCASANIEALARYAGLQARGWAITLHSVPEIYYDNAWHLLDASLITYFPKPDGSLAGVQEISQSVAEFLKAHPELRGDDKKLLQFSSNNGWKKGPAALSNCPLYDVNGWLPAATHGWSSSMVEYARPDRNFPYEYGTALGYQVNNQLRKGERITFNWSNKGLHVNMFDGAAPGCLKKSVGQEDLRYATKYGDLAPGRVGNGLHEYAPRLADSEFRDACLEFTNLRQTPDGIRLQDPARGGILVLRMPSSYVYLTGELAAHATGAVSAAFSDNNGLDWTDLPSPSTDLTKLVFRRYDYRLKFTFKGADAALQALKIRHDIQHSQRPLPALAQGENQITVSAGPQEGTVTVEGSTTQAFKGKQLLFTDFHPTLQGVRPAESGLWIGDSGSATISIPIATPGDITRLRLGLHYRARDKRDGWTIAASLDNGATWKEMGKAEGPVAGNSLYFTLGNIPQGSRSALVRLTGQQRNTAGIFDLRLDADYLEPRGGLAPIQVTYNWEEDGQPRTHSHTAKTASETYTISCAARPLLKSLILQRD